jgi:hypothetical protein
LTTPRWRARLAALLLAAAFAPACHAGLGRYCDAPADPGAKAQDRLLQLAGVIKSTLDRSGQRLAIVARSGLDLGRFGQRYSHAGVSLVGNPQSVWAVRQLYYACDERLPRLFDQGMAGFVMGLRSAGQGFVSVLLLPPDRAARLEQAVLDDRRALALLGAVYSANAFAFSLQYQNCNQWLAEMLATAWAPADGNTEPDQMRAGAQAWLLHNGYEPTVFEVGWRPLMWLAALSPWLHSDDHPAEDIEQQRFRVSMPAAIDAFVRQREPSAERVEFCLAGERIVVRHGWQPLGDDCEAAPGDSVHTMD